MAVPRVVSEIDKVPFETLAEPAAVTLGIEREV